MSLVQGNPPSNSTAAADRGGRGTYGDTTGPLWPATITSYSITSWNHYSGITSWNDYIIVLHHGTITS